MNGLTAIRDMIEHFDDYAADEGRGLLRARTTLIRGERSRAIGLSGADW